MDNFLIKECRSKKSLVNQLCYIRKYIARSIKSHINMKVNDLEFHVSFLDNIRISRCYRSWLELEVQYGEILKRFSVTED